MSPNLLAAVIALAVYTETPPVYEVTGIYAKPLATEEASHTPMAEVVRVLSLLPKPEIGFVDFGCGYDARWCVAAAEQWKCKVTGVEIDPQRAAAARDRVRQLGLDRYITIVEGDATTTQVDADVGVAYLYPEVLGKLRPQLERLRAFASYIHEIPGLPGTKNGDSWLYTRQSTTQITQLVQQQQSHGAVWGGRVFFGRQCNNPNCAMCNSIDSQLAANQRPAQAAASPSGWHLETRVQKVKYCNGRQCWFVDQQVQVWVQDR